SKEDKKYFEGFFLKNSKDYNRVMIDDFKCIDVNKIQEICFFPVRKKIKEIDMIDFCPFKLGLDFLISKKLFDIMNNFNLPPVNKIPTRINTFNTEYFLIGFPMIPQERIDLNKSIFFDTKKRSEFNLKSYDAFINTDFSVKPRKIYPDVFYDVDAIGFQGKGLFFSNRLIDAIQDAGIVGLHVDDTEMEMNP
ncbi:hypothetical protein FY562_24100, partial [Salmonella enterica]|nr:hypothetical protein [Salmonella enterica]